MQELTNLIGADWLPPHSQTYQDVINPATGETCARVPISDADDVAAAVEAAEQAFPGWRATPTGDRVQYLFRLKTVLEDNLETLAALITQECGKTLGEARGELRRGIENVEVACGMPSLIQGYNNEDIASGIDESLFRQPVGVVTAITPFNFPGMIPLWFLPYAVAAGNCFLLKPSEQTPQTASRLAELIQSTGLPAGVVQVVHGGSESAEALIKHPGVRAVSFVGSTPVARQVYQLAAAHGKRVQCQGGAKNPLIILPDAEMEMTTTIAADSAFGCAGQRCLAASLAITVGSARDAFCASISEAARRRVVGVGTAEDVEMGPLISSGSRSRILDRLEAGFGNGAQPLVDGRSGQVSGFEKGSFLFPTVVELEDRSSPLAEQELFGPVLGILSVNTVDEAIDLVNQGRYGNMACLFTTSGAAARKFRYEARVGNLGINLGVAAPMAYFPFSGWRESFFGDLHAQGRHAVEFYTETKVVAERWPQHWSRTF